MDNLLYDIKAKTLEYFPLMLNMMQILENEDRDCKLFKVFPLSTSEVPGHIAVDTNTLIQVFKLGYHLRVGVGSVTNNSQNVWSKFIDLNKIKRKNYNFAYVAKTDGISVSFILRRVDLERRIVPIYANDGNIISSIPPTTTHPPPPIAFGVDPLLRELQTVTTADPHHTGNVLELVESVVVGNEDVIGLKEKIKRFIFDNRLKLKYKKVKDDGNSLYNALLKQTKSNKTTNIYMNNCRTLIINSLNSLLDNNNNNNQELKNKLINWFNFFKVNDNKDFIVYGLIPTTEDPSIISDAFYNKAMRGNISGIITLYAVMHQKHIYHKKKLYTNYIIEGDILIF